MTGKAIDTRIGTREQYAKLAELADRYHVKFHVIAEQFEDRGKSIDQIKRRLQVESTEGEWLTTERAERIVPKVAKAWYETRAIERTERIGHKCLWAAVDVLWLRAIMDKTGLSVGKALRVLAARKEGAI